MREYANFLTYDGKHKRVCECSCDPRLLGNYFLESTYPYEMSPVFFRPDVLLKYKADSEKYLLTSRSIRCRNAWDLRTFDINVAGQIHTYLVYLGQLPHAEQLYWKSFNEAPKGGISDRAIATDFHGRFAAADDPLKDLRALLWLLTKEDVAWWTLRSRDLLRVAHYPVTTSRDEWATEIHTLDKLLVEGLEKGELKKQCSAFGRECESVWGSLRVAEELLVAIGYAQDDAKVLVWPLRQLNAIRSKVSGHASGKEGNRVRAQVIKEFRTYKAHYRSVVRACEVSLKELRDVLHTRVYKPAERS